MMYRFLLLVQCVLLAVATGDECEEMWDCADNLGNYYHSFENTVNLLSNASSLDDICGELNGLTACISQNDTACNTSTSEAIYTSYLRAVSNYLCSSDGRELITRLSDVPCFKNYDHVYDEELAVCQNQSIIDMVDETKDTCLTYNTANTCMSEAAQTVCNSEDMGRFTLRLFQIALTFEYDVDLSDC